MSQDELGLTVIGIEPNGVTRSLYLLREILRRVLEPELQPVFVDVGEPDISACELRIDGERFQEQDWVCKPAMTLIEKRGGRRA